MTQMIFVNLPVTDVQRSRIFFTGLGFSINEQFSDESAASVVISDTIVAMLLQKERFQTFTPRPVAESAEACEVLIALSRDSKEDVDRICNAAFSLGGRRYKDAEDLGFMYQWGFEDPDGHTWEMAWMDPAAMPA